MDDSEGYRELLVWTLERHGFQIISAECGREGVELAIERQPALVLMDLYMCVANSKLPQNSRV